MTGTPKVQIGLENFSSPAAGTAKLVLPEQLSAETAERLARALGQAVANLFPHAGPAHRAVSLVPNPRLPCDQANDADDDGRVPRAAGRLFPVGSLLSARSRICSPSPINSNEGAFCCSA